MVERPSLKPLLSKTGKVLDLIAIREIQDDCLCLATSQKNEREYKAVVIVDPVNFSLMSDNEQESILSGFRVLLTRMNADEEMSIHIRVRPYELTQYIDKLEQAKKNKSSDRVYQDMAADHQQYVLGLTSQRALLQREFYVRIGVKSDKAKKLRPSERYDRAKSALDLRVHALIEDLQRSGLTSRRLQTEELVRYYQSCLHTHNAETYPVSQNNLYATDFPTRAASASVLKAQAQAQKEVLRLSELASDLPIEPMIAYDDALRQRERPQQEKEEAKPARRWVWQSSKRIERDKQAFERKQQKAEKPQPYTELVSIPELIQPSLIEQREQYIRVHHETDEYFRSRSIVGYPAFVVSGWLDRLIQIDEPYVDILLFVETLNSTSYTTKLTRKLTGFQATRALDIRRGKTENPYIKAAKEEVEELRDSIVQQVEKVHSISLYICSRGSTRQELKERDSKVLSMLRGLDLQSVELSLEHLQAWLCCLPDSRDILKKRKVLDTSSVVTGFPFASSTLSTEPGALVGVMPNGSLVIINPTSDQLENGHEVKFARSGAGKSYDEKVRLMRYLLLGYEAVVIDPEDEYLALCQQFKGANIRLSAGTLGLNPFDLVVANKSERNILEEKFQSLLVLFDLLLADKDPGTLSQREKGYLTKCMVKVYADRGITSDPATHSKQPPNMYELYEVINDGGVGPDTYNLGDRLSRFLTSFPHETLVSLDNPLTVFNIRDLSDELKPAGLFLITDYVWTQVRREKVARPRLLVIDEAWTLLQFQEGGRFLAGLSRRARKYNLCLRTITQDVEDFLASEWGRTILVNSSMKFLMKQDSTTIDAVSRAFKLSDNERQFLLGAAKGEGLFFARSSHVPLRVIASQVEHRIATTNPQELLKRELEQMAREEEEERSKRQEAVAVKQREDEYSIVFPRVYTGHRIHDPETE